jgi:hypothetical protein
MNARNNPICGFFPIKYLNKYRLYHVILVTYLLIFSRFDISGSVSKYRIDGKRQADSTWTFSNGRKMDMFYWYPGEPRSTFKSIALRTSYKGKWDDVLETVAHGFICELTPSIT